MEIRKCYPDKNLTIIDRNSSCLHKYSPSLIKSVNKILSEANVRLLLTYNVTKIIKNSQIIIDNNVRIDADKIICATGTIPNIMPVLNTMPWCVAENGGILINNALQTHRFNNIFVGGDITSLAKMNQASTAIIHGFMIERNICRMIRGKNALCFGKKGMPKKINMYNSYTICLGNKTIMDYHGHIFGPFDAIKRIRDAYQYKFIKSLAKQNGVVYNLFGIKPYPNILL
eukprot:Pompholyxophrys_sp_v1_NODE_4_length_15125_cov_6.573656.p7 type:complete len:229 gc:universal NODE_4_length_15125_cov_6.573656:13082-13768(+)